MTREQLQAVLDGLVAIVKVWSHQSPDSQYGRGHDGICITVWWDGSGAIGRRGWGDNQEDNDLSTFVSLDEFMEQLQAAAKIK